MPESPDQFFVFLQHNDVQQLRDALEEAQRHHLTALKARAEIDWLERQYAKERA